MLRVSTAVPNVLSPSAQVHMGKFLEALGFEGLWLPDHLLFPEGSAAYDPWSIMGPLACSTKRALIGPAVTDHHRLHPAVLAQKLATLDHFSKGRMVLGLGSGEAMNLEPYGIEWTEQKVRKMSEFLSVLSGLLDSREPFTFEGDFYQLKNAQLSVRPYKDRHIPIYMAALGPMMQKLAGKKVDGWMPTILPAEAYSDYFAPIAESARKHGRDPDEFVRTATVVVSLDTDNNTPLSEVLTMVRPVCGALVWAPVMERLGFDFNPPPEAQSSYMDVNPCEPESLAKYWELQRWMPDEVISEALCHGSVNDVTHHCRSFVEEGANHLYVYFGSPDPIGSYIVFAHEVLPKLTGRPPTLLARTLGRLLGPLIRNGTVKNKFPAPPMRMKPKP